MKKLILTFIFMMMFTLVANADPIAHFESSSGVLDVVGYETAVEDGKTLLFIIFDWTNNKNEPDAPGWNYAFSGYQNGRQIENGWTFYNEPKGCDNSTVSIQPGYSLRYYQTFYISDYSPVDMIIQPIVNFEGVKTEFTIDPSTSAPSSEGPSADAPEVTTLSDALRTSDSDKIAELEQRIADLEVRVAALEGN